MKKKILIFCLLTPLLLFGLSVIIRKQPVNHLLTALRTSREAGDGGRANIYMPKYQVVDRQTAEYYANLFKVQGEIIEDDGVFMAADGGGLLSIDRYLAVLTYLFPETEAPPSSPAITDAYLLDTAAQFFDEKKLFVPYMEALVEETAEGYSLSYITALNGIKNHAFPILLNFDLSGRPISLVYAFTTYERINTCKVIRAEEAAAVLNRQEYPADPSTAQLVYFYENSILQPAYLFTGMGPDGQVYNCYVNAAVYE